MRWSWSIATDTGAVVTVCTTWAWPERLRLTRPPYVRMPLGKPPAATELIGAVYPLVVH
jgi:hypothetical protein